MISAQHDKLLSRVSEIFIRYGIKSITMDDISRELGISKKTLYQMVNNKNELVLKVVEYHIKEEIDRGECWKHDAEDALEENLIVMQNVIREMQMMRSNIIHDMQKYHHEAWKIMQEYHRGGMLERVRDNLARGVQEGLYRNDFDLDLVARIHVAQAFTLLDETWFPVGEFSRDRLFHEYMLQYLNGILTTEGRERLKAKLS